jgi:hypothetical protein
MRANHVFVQIKSSVQRTWLWVKAKTVQGGFYARSSIAHGCAFHPCAIDDPRGRLPSAQAQARKLKEPQGARRNSPQRKKGRNPGLFLSAARFSLHGLAQH